MLALLVIQLARQAHARQALTPISTGVDIFNASFMTSSGCRYDDLKSTQDNIDLQSTILSRFDLIFIVKDERTVDHDTKIARYASLHRCCMLVSAW